MTLKILFFSVLLFVTGILSGQGLEINQTDPQGRKQGQWIKYYPNSNVYYEGFFKDDHPVGELKRYYKDKVLKSVLTFSTDGNEASAKIYHPNGYLSARGRYVNQQKEGKWEFFSISTDGYKISEEFYIKNKKNGQSLKFFPDSTVAERVTYDNDIRNGEWISYYPSGSVCMKSSYMNGKINGKFEAWYENGKIQFSGQYKNNSRDGLWLIYNYDGSIKYKLNYFAGITNDNQMDLDESDYLDSLEQNPPKIADPDKTGVIW